MNQKHFRLQAFEECWPGVTRPPEISGVISREQTGSVVIEFQITDNADSIDWPHLQAGISGQRRDELWKHTCLELFIQPVAQKQYWEFNVSPAGDWNCYHFTDYRNEMKTEDSVESIKTWLSRSDDLQTTVQITLPLPPALKDTDWSVGVCAVLQDKQQSLHYYAIKHCDKKPDFHLSNSFTLVLKNEP